MLELVGDQAPPGISLSFPYLNPLWQAVIERRQQGHVFLDETEPTGGLICSTATGFYFLFGDPKAAWVHRDLPRVLGEIEHVAGWFGLLVDGEHWRSRLLDVFGNDTPTSTRVQFGFDRERVSAALTPPSPTEQSVVPMDAKTTPLVLSAGQLCVWDTLAIHG